MSAPRNWGKLDSAFVLGFCSRCPVTEVLMELALNCPLPISQRSHAAILVLIGQIDDYLREQYERLPYQTVCPDVLQMSHLENICDSIMATETGGPIHLAYDLGVVIGKTIGMSEWNCRKLSEADHQAVLLAIRSLPPTWQHAVADIPIVIARSKENDVRSAILQFVPNGFGTTYSLIEPLLDRLKILDAVGDQQAPRLSSDDDGTSICVSEGPMPPDGFWYNGNRYDVPPGKVFRLINTLWNAPERTVSFLKLAEPVWEDCNRYVTIGMVRSPQSRANTFFLSNEMPFEIRVLDKHARLQDR